MGEPPRDPRTTRSDEAAANRTVELLASARRGDRLAEYRLWTDLRRHLVARARAHPQMEQLRAHVTEDDVVQEVWLRVRKPGALESFEDRGPGSLRGFLGAFLDNTMLDLVRRHAAVRRGGNERVGSLQDQGDRTRSLQVQDESPTPTSEARVDEARRGIEEALPAREWEVWRLRHDEGLDFTEIAERTGTTADAARALHRRVRERLERHMGMLQSERAGRPFGSFQSSRSVHTRSIADRPPGTTAESAHG